VPLSIYFNERGIAKVELGRQGQEEGRQAPAEKAKDWQRQKGRVMRREE